MKMKRRQFLLKQICEQQKWIEKCERNRQSSYYGKNAAAVRKADFNALRELEKALNPTGAGLR